MDRNSHSLQASSPILSSRASRASTFHDIPQMESLLAGYNAHYPATFPLLPKGLLAHVSAFDWLEILSVELRLRRKSKNEKGRKLQTAKFRQLRFLGGKL